MINNVQSLIEQEEGRRAQMYHDQDGNPTIGIGHLILPHEQWMLTATLTDQQIDDIFADDMKIASLAAASVIDNFFQLNDVRRAVVLSMLFNMGKPRFMGFGEFIAALENEDYNEAAKQMIDSEWDKEVPNRVSQLDQLMISGVWA